MLWRTKFIRRLFNVLITKRAVSRNYIGTVLLLLLLFLFGIFIVARTFFRRDALAFCLFGPVFFRTLNLVHNDSFNLIKGILLQTEVANKLSNLSIQFSRIARFFNTDRLEVVLNVHVQTPTKRHRIPFVLSDTIVNILR
jgi:hypothetical protein